MATKSTKPKILFVKRTDELVNIRHEAMTTREQKTVPDKNKPGETKIKEVQSAETIDVESHDVPLESFDNALSALGSVAAVQLGCGTDWGAKIDVVSLSISYNERGVRTVVINFTKPLLKGSVFHPLKTPAFQIEDDKQSGETRQCHEKHADLIIDVIKQAQKYVLGERGQGVLGFEEEDDKIEQLPGMEKQPDPAND